MGLTLIKMTKRPITIMLTKNLMITLIVINSSTAMNAFSRQAITVFNATLNLEVSER
jgi:hypothetical protein